MTNKYKNKIGVVALVALVSLFSCKKDDVEEVQSDRIVAKTSGIIIRVTAPSGSQLVKYLEEIPSSEVDMSDGLDFQTFTPADIFDGAIYMSNPSGSGYSKVVVDDETSEIVVEKTIATAADGSSTIAIKDANTGLFHDTNTPDLISVFDPSTMTVSGTINMSDGHTPDGSEQRYREFFFRDNLVYATIRAIDGNHYDPYTIHVADVSTGAYVGSTSSTDSGAVATHIGFGQRNLDEAGNLYISTQSDVSQFLPARIFRVNAGSNEIDQDYTWRPAQVLNPQLLGLPTIRGFRYLENGKAIALVNSTLPSEILSIVFAAGGTANLTQAQIVEIQSLLTQSEGALWCVIDVNAKTVVPIAGIPSSSGLVTIHTTQVDDKIYIPIATTSENAVYEYDLSSGSASKVFDVSGGQIGGIYNLAYDH